MEEVWRPIYGYEDKYYISNFGRIKSFAQDSENGKIKTGNLTFKGYLSITLYYKSGNHKTYPVHRLVAIAFIDNPDNLPQVNHKDENKTNNCVDNLEWCTNEYNAHYGTKIQRTVEANRCCETTSIKIYSVDANGNTEYYDSIGEAEHKTGCSHSNIVRTLKGRSNHCGGKQWFYY